MNNIRWAEPELSSETTRINCSHCGRLRLRELIEWNSDAATWYCKDGRACFSYMYEKSNHQRVFDDRIWERVYVAQWQYALRRLMFWRWREVIIEDGYKMLVRR